MLVRTSSQILEHMESEIEVSPRKKLGCNPQSFSKETHLMNLWVDSAFNSWSIYIYIYLDTDTYTYTYTFTCYISVYVCIYIYTYRLVSSWISFDGSYSSSMFFFLCWVVIFWWYKWQTRWSLLSPTQMPQNKLEDLQRWLLWWILWPWVILDLRERYPWSWKDMCIYIYIDDVIYRWHINYIFW